MSLETLITGRTLQGIGGGGLITMVEVVITDMVPLAERASYFSILAVIWTFGSVAGIFLSFSEFWLSADNRTRCWWCMCWSWNWSMAMVYISLFRY